MMTSTISDDVLHYIASKTMIEAVGDKAGRVSLEDFEKV